MNHPVKARYSSNCACCGNRIFVGDEIRVGAANRWVHANCAPNTSQVMIREVAKFEGNKYLVERFAEKGIKLTFHSLQDVMHVSLDDYMQIIRFSFRAYVYADETGMFRIATDAKTGFVFERASSQEASDGEMFVVTAYKTEFKPAPPLYLRH